MVDGIRANKTIIVAFFLDTFANFVTAIISGPAVTTGGIHHNTMELRSSLHASPLTCFRLTSNRNTKNIVLRNIQKKANKTVSSKDRTALNFFEKYAKSMTPENGEKKSMGITTALKISNISLEE